jgi:hypothetical protein
MRLAGTVTYGVPYQNPTRSSTSPNLPRELWMAFLRSSSKSVEAATPPVMSPAVTQSPESQRPGEPRV